MLRYSGLAAKVAALAFVLSRGVRLSWVFGPRIGGGSELARATLGSSFIASALYVLVGLSRVEEIGVAGSPSMVEQIVAFGLAVTLTPILEELIFRGVFLRCLLDKIPTILAVGLSALVFGAFHASIVRASAAFALGLVLGVLMVRTKSLAVCIVAHSAWNLTVRGVDLSQTAQSAIVALRTADLDGAFAATAIAVGILLLVLRISNSDRSADERPRNP